MQFQFMHDKRWTDLDDDTKQGMVAASFEDDVMSDQRWAELDDDTKQQMQDSYIQSASEYQEELNDLTRQNNLETKSDVSRGLSSGIDESQATFYGAGALLGSGMEKLGAKDTGQKLQDWGMEGYKRNMGEASLNPVNTLDDISGVGSAIDWAQGTFGKLIPSMAVAALGSTTGVGLAAIGSKTVFKKTVQKIAEKQIKDSVARGLIKAEIAETAKKAVANSITKQAMRMAGKTGMGAAVLPMESGGNYASLLEQHGVDAPMTALGFGALSTSLEFLGGNSKLVDQFLGAVVGGKGSIAKRTAMELIKNVPAEAMQEAGQEVFSVLNTVVNTDERFFTKENAKQVFESAAAGAIGGGVGGFTSGLLSKQTASPTPVSDIGNATSVDEAVQAFESSVNNSIDKEIFQQGLGSQPQMGETDTRGYPRVADVNPFEVQNKPVDLNIDKEIGDLERSLQQAQADIQTFPDRPPIQPDVEALRTDYENKQSEQQGNVWKQEILNQQGQRQFSQGLLSQGNMADTDSQGVTRYADVNPFEQPKDGIKQPSNKIPEQKQPTIVNEQVKLPGESNKPAAETIADTTAVNETSTVAPGATVTWANKKGQTLSGTLVSKRPGSKSTWLIDRGDGKRTFLTDKNFSIVPKEEISEATPKSGIDTREKAINNFVDTRVSSDLKIAMERGADVSQDQIDNVKNEERYRTNEFVEDIENKNFDSMKARLHRGNKESLKLFSEVTGLSTKTQRETNESIRALDPVKYDEWVNTKKQKLDDAEAKNKAAEKETAQKAMLEAKTNYDSNGYHITFEQHIKDLIDNGYTDIEVTEGKFPTTKLIKHENGGKGRRLVSQIFRKKIEQEYVQKMQGQHSDKIIAEDIAREGKEEADNPGEFASDEELDHLFNRPKKENSDQVGTKPNSLPTLKELTEREFKVGDTVLLVQGFNDRPKTIDYINSNGKIVLKGNNPKEYWPQDIKKIDNETEESDNKAKPTTKEVSDEGSTENVTERPGVQSLDKEDSETVSGGREGLLAGDVVTETTGHDSVLGEQPTEDARGSETPGTVEEDSLRSGMQDDGGVGQSESVGDGPVGREDASGTGLADNGPGGTRDSGDPRRVLENYHIEDPEALIGGTPKVRFKKNQKAIETFNEVSNEGRRATEEDLASMASYIGWGSFGQELFQGTFEHPTYRDGWKKENDWLREHLGKSAWESAQASIINAHYTDPPTVSAIWDIVKKLGFKGGRVLEPSMGVGNFFGLMPKDLKSNSDLTGIELDETTAGMAKMLYPNANIQQMGYQDSKTADGFYDLVLGNWPFAAQGPSDRRYNKYNLTLHDYFFVKALDQVRDGGLVVGITASGTMDKVGKIARSQMGKRADLVAAFRMPSGAFTKYAGTSVVADIIILQKRAEGVAANHGAAWLDNSVLGQASDGKDIKINEYWTHKPENVLGKMGIGHGTTHGREGMIVERKRGYEKVLTVLSELMPENNMPVYEAVAENVKTPDAKYSTTTDTTNKTESLDRKYLDAVHSGDMETAQEMVIYAAKQAGVPIFDESKVTAYTVRRTPPPQKTTKAYKLFRVKASKPGEVFALFVGATNPLPTGVWLDATAGPKAPDSKTGKAKVKSKLGPLAYRPGWHAGDVPLATHIGAKNGPKGKILGRKIDEVWAEVDMASDIDYQPEATANGTREDGAFVVGDADIKRMPKNGLYRYKTNPNMTGQWIISGAMKINKILSEKEVNQILKADGQTIMPWAEKPKGSKEWVKTKLDLNRWGLTDDPAVNQKKIIDPVTYDNNGEPIPLSKRFNITETDPRYSSVEGIIDTSPGKGISKKDILSAVPGQKSTINKDGSISIQLKNGHGLKINTVEHIGGDDIRFAMETGRMDDKGVILGKYQDHTITLNKNLANKKTVTHEIKHFLDSIGAITKMDNAIIDSRTKKLVDSGKYAYEVTGDKLEDRANTLAQIVDDRDSFRAKSSLHRIAQKVVDFLDGLVHIGRQSERKLAREFESGDIYNREAGAGNDTDARFQTSNDIPTEPEKKKAYSQMAAGLSNVLKNRKNKGKGYKKDIGVIENTLGLMSHYSEGIPALKKAFEELLKRPEWKFEKENELFKNGEESMIGTIEDLQKHNKPAYSDLKDYLIDRDINQTGSVIFQADDDTWTIKSPKNERTGKRSVLEKGIATKKNARDLVIQYEVDEYPDTVSRDALRAFRNMTSNLHDFYAESWETLIKEYEDRGITLPEVVTKTKAGEVRMDLKLALAKMGDRSSYYFPRQRSNGDWQVVATKKGEHKFIEYRDHKITADYLAGKMKSQGYDVEVEKVGSMSEDVYQGIKNILSTQSMVNQALAETKMDVKLRGLKDLGLRGEWRGDSYYIPSGGVYEWSSSVLARLGGREYSDKGKRGNSWSPGYWFEDAPKDIETVVTNALYVSRGQETDVAFEIAQGLANQLSDTLRARGSRARMISRSEAIGQDVPMGYETDPLKAIAQAVNSAAGGYAKQQVAMNTSKAITGQHYTWDEWQKQHPDYEALLDAESKLESLQKNSDSEENRIADIDNEVKELQRERAGVKTESEKARQDRLLRIGTLFREKEKIRKWTDKKQAAKAHRDIARLRGGIHSEYREYIQENMIDPKRQKRAYTDIVNAVENVLKNDEAADRVIGTLKGLASVWFLGGRLSSAAINLTAIGTTVPAAMNSYGGIPLRRTAKHIAKAGKAYASFITGKGTVSKADREVLEDIFSKGWVAAQLNMETVTALKSGPAQKYGRVVELLMTPFKITEEFNRGVTILAAYKGIIAEKPNMSKDDALAKAKTVSDRAHGIYGVENQPALLRKGRGLRAASAMYIFQTFIHNYFTTLSYMIGRKQAGAATYMILSPMVFGGAASSVLMPAVKMIFKAFDEDDPEEKIYQIAEELFGETGSDVARYGIPGLAGVSLKGSLAPNLPDFREPLDALGPIGGMMGNIYQGGVNLTQGHFLKGVEKLSPLFLSNIAKAYRESSQGVTTRGGDAVFFGDEQIRGDIGSGIMRAAGLNPTRISKPREIQWNETTLKRQYAARKRNIYSRIVNYHARPLSKKNPSDWRDIIKEIKEFNARVKSHKLNEIVPIITTKTIKNRIKRAFRPNRRERNRT